MTIAVSQTVGTLWGPVGVTDSSISITLANRVGKGTIAIVVDAELGESRAGLTDESTGTKTESISITLANGVGKGTVAVVVDAKLGEPGAGLTDESTSTKTESFSISITLAKALWGPLGV